MIDTSIDEVADGIYRVSSLVPRAVAGRDVTVNQFVVLADEPLVFHAGLRSCFRATAAAVAGLVPLDRLRWLSFGHVEADECGAMNLYLAAAPHLQVAFGAWAARSRSRTSPTGAPCRSPPGRSSTWAGGASW